MFLGVDYYPEQWDAKMLDEDLDTIVELGSNVIRIAEFSWHLMEKTEGNYDFSFFDHVIERAKAKGLKVIMGTPIIIYHTEALYDERRDNYCQK